MPTKFAFVLVILSIGLYFIANQTQVGWVYVMVNALIALLIVAFFYSQGMLRSIQGRRTFRNQASDISGSSTPAPIRRQLQSNATGTSENLPLLMPDFYEDDPVAVTLQLTNTRLKPAFLVNGQELCPFAPPAEQRQQLFAPSLFKNQTESFTYQTTCYRRGFYSFSVIPLRSKGPFNLFGTRRRLTVPGDVLIYPKYHALKRIRLLENRGFADKKVVRVGAGSEVIGTREYRSGDSLRQIHWRSTARVGKLVVKEFSDDDQLSMTVVLDLSAQSSIGEGKFSTFETAIRLAASLGYYATHQNIPFHLVGDSRQWKPPAMALSWSGLLNYLAKVNNDGQKPLTEILPKLPSLPYVVVLCSNPEETIGQKLALLQARGTKVLAIFITLDGALPPAAIDLNKPGLEVRSASPDNWSTMLAEL